MGLLLTGGILITFYILKLACPQFIVGVAELPTIVTIGTFIDSNSFLYHLFNIIIGYIGGYIYCCACLRKRSLNLKNNIILISIVLFLSLVLILIPLQYTAINYVSLCVLPFLMSFFDKAITKEIYISATVCFSVEILSQSLSAVIRDLFAFTTHINSATMTILLIDVWIWRGILYMFFNFKKGE